MVIFSRNRMQLLSILAIAIVCPHNVSGGIIHGLAPVVVKVTDSDGGWVAGATVVVQSIGYADLEERVIDRESKVLKLIEFAKKEKRTDYAGFVVMLVPSRGVSEKEGATRALKGTVTVSKKGHKSRIIDISDRKQIKPSRGKSFQLEILSVVLEKEEKAGAMDGAKNSNSAEGTQQAGTRPKKNFMGTEN